MSRIIVAGAGHGGLVAAMKLSQIGHNVTVYEQKEEDFCGLDQQDAFDSTVLEQADLPMPREYIERNNSMSFVPLAEDAPTLTMPPSQTAKSITVDRKILHKMLREQAVLSGVKIVYGCRIFSPVVYGSRVVGIETDKGIFLGDLIIDACGVNSPIRKKLPEFMLCDSSPKMYDELHTYRVFFEKKNDVPDPENYYQLFIKYDGTEGFSWAITEKDCIDVLICRFPLLSKDEVIKEIRQISQYCPNMETKVIKVSGYNTIPVRQPEAIFVADGYAAIGDSAFMTQPTKGSGIENSIKAALILSQVVQNDKDGLFICDTLWEYERQFFHSIGFNMCRHALARNLLNYMSAQEVSNLFKSGLISNEELERISEEGLGILTKTNILGILRDKMRILGDVPGVKNRLLSLTLWAGRMTATEALFPEKYSREGAEKWKNRYDEFFESIRRKEDEPEKEEMKV